VDQTGGGGGGVTDLTFTRNGTTVTVESSTGTDAVLPAATTSLAGVLTGADKTKLDGIATGATANSPDATLLARANHTGTQAAATITGLAATATSTDAANLTGTLAAARIADGSLSIAKTSGLQTALDGKAATSHTHEIDDVTGLQAALDSKTNVGHTHVSTAISDFASASRAQVEAALIAGANITITPAGTGATRTLTIASSGGGGGGAGLHIGDTAPANPTANPLWWRSDIGELFVWYEDGTSDQWVSAGGGSITTGGGGGGATNLTFTRDGTTVTIESDTGTDAILPAATTSLAGVLSAADKTKLDGIATGATANSTDAVLLARANHTGTQAASTITGLATVATSGAYSDLSGAPSSLPPSGGAGGVLSGTYPNPGFAVDMATQAELDAGLAGKANTSHTHVAANITDFNSASRAQTEAALVAGTNITITPAGSGATRTLTIAAAGGGAGTNLTYDAATRVIASDTGTDATLPLMSSGNAGLVPASGGGTTNFLRADGTFAALPLGVTGGAARYDNLDDSAFVFGREYLSYFHKQLIARAGTATTTTKIVFSGDSTTDGAAAGTPFRLWELIPEAARRLGIRGVIGVNRGQPSQGTAQWVSTYLAGDLAETPDLLVLRWGANDPFLGGNKASFVANLRAGLTTIRAARSVSQLSIVLATPNTMNDTFNGRDAAWFVSIADEIKRAARDFQCCFIDVYQYLRTTGSDWMDEPNANGVNIHPLAVMNTWIATLHIDAIFPAGLVSSISETQVINPSGFFQWKLVTDLIDAYETGMTIYRAVAGFPHDGTVITWKNADGQALQFNHGFSGTDSVYSMRRWSVTGPGWTAWVTVPGAGGGGSPGGTSGQVQFNNAGAFAGAANVEIEGGNLRLLSTTTPATPAAGGLNLFARDIGGGLLPAYIGPSGLDSSLQPFLGGNNVSFARANGNGTSISTFGTATTGFGTATFAGVTGTGSFIGWIRRIDYLVTTASTTAIAGNRGPGQQYGRGNGPGRGGFRIVLRGGPATGPSTSPTMRMFLGLRATVVNPSDVAIDSLPNIIAFGLDAGDSECQIFHNGATGTATKVALGPSFPRPTVDRDNLYEAAFFCPPFADYVGWRVTDLVSGAQASGLITTNLPSETTLFNYQQWCSSGGTSSVVGYTFLSAYMETDY
jgi:hypothetical protein